MHIHRVVNLLDPIRQVGLLVLHRIRILAVLYRPKHPQHPRRRPRVASRPVAGIRPISHNDMPPKIARVCVSQIIAIQLDLRVRLLEHGAVRRRDTIVREEGRNHVGEIGPNAHVKQSG